ncbi:gliding motility lipoprotein GldB [Fulvitalea axinellae]
MKNVFLILFAFALLTACGAEKDTCVDKPDLGGIKVDLNIERLEDDWKNCESEEAMLAFMNRNPEIASVFFKRDQYPNDSIFAKVMLERAKNPAVDTLYNESKKRFGDFSDIRADLEETFKSIKYQYPDFVAPKVKTIISGLANDMYYSDSLIVIGLDFYLGKGATFRPINYPSYVLRRYDKPYIVPGIALLMSQRYNLTNGKDRTMLSDMVFYGKSYYFAKQILPCTPDSLLIGYTKEEYEEANEHQPVIWASLLQNEMIYETGHMEKSRFMDERPNTTEIGPKCPGRIGRFVGWKIVNEYMERKPETSLKRLMAEKNSTLIFKESKYKPS